MYVNRGKRYGDAKRIQQILLNLVSNAIKFSYTGGRITVRIENDRNRQLLHSQNLMSAHTLFNEYIKFSVIDTGVGIKEDNINKLFKSANGLISDKKKKEKVVKRRRKPYFIDT